MPPLDATRYRLDAPPASRRHDLAAWKTSVDNAHSQLEHQYLRIINLELMLKYGDKVRGGSGGHWGFHKRKASAWTRSSIAPLPLPSLPSHGTELARPGAASGLNHQEHCSDSHKHTELRPPPIPSPTLHNRSAEVPTSLFLPPSTQNWRAQGQLVDSIAKQYETELAETKKQITAVNLERKLQQTAAGEGGVWKEIPDCHGAVRVQRQVTAVISERSCSRPQQVRGVAEQGGREEQSAGGDMTRSIRNASSGRLQQVRGDGNRGGRQIQSRRVRTGGGMQASGSLGCVNFQVWWWAL